MLDASEDGRLDEIATIAVAAPARHDAGAFVLPMSM
jgi:hypothetical protein